MGYEYKIIAKFTDKQTRDMLKLLEEEKYFDKKYEYAGKEIIEFRHIENQ